MKVELKTKLYINFIIFQTNVYCSFIENFENVNFKSNLVPFGFESFRALEQANIDNTSTYEKPHPCHCCLMRHLHKLPPHLHLQYPCDGILLEYPAGTLQQEKGRKAQLPVRKMGQSSIICDTPAIYTQNATL